MEKFLINGRAGIHFNVEVAANSEKEAKEKVRNMDSSDLNVEATFIECNDLDVESL